MLHGFEKFGARIVNGNCLILFCCGLFLSEIVIYYENNTRNVLSDYKLQSLDDVQNLSRLFFSSFADVVVKCAVKHIFILFFLRLGSRQDFFKHYLKKSLKTWLRSLQVQNCINYEI